MSTICSKKFFCNPDREDYFTHFVFPAVLILWHYFRFNIIMKKNEKRTLNRDIQDHEKDKKKMQPEETTLDLPDVKEIPGQEHIRPPRMNEFVDVTPSSDDEEGKGLLDFSEDEMDDNSNVSLEEKELLEKSATSQGSKDDKQLQDATLDNVDDEGELLNERSDLSAKDLDVPGSEQDDANEQLGTEDEENNSYSLGGDKNN